MLAIIGEHLGQLVCMALIIFGSQRINRRVQRRQVEVETQRLRGALSLMLRALHDIHESNLRVISSRNSI